MLCCSILYLKLLPSQRAHDNHLDYVLGVCAINLAFFPAQSKLLQASVMYQCHVQRNDVRIANATGKPDGEPSLQDTYMLLSGLWS